MTDDKLEIWCDLRFNVFFKGDDWQGTEKGARLERQFAEVGVEVALPATRTFRPLGAYEDWSTSCVRSRKRQG